MVGIARAGLTAQPSISVGNSGSYGDVVVDYGSRAVLEGRTGFPATRYQWYKASVPIPGATQIMLTLPRVTAQETGVIRSVSFRRMARSTPRK